MNKRQAFFCPLGKCGESGTDCGVKFFQGAPAAQNYVEGWSVADILDSPCGLLASIMRVVEEDKNRPD